MEKVLVSLLLVIVAVLAFVSLQDWSSEQRATLINNADDKINIVLNENK